MQISMKRAVAGIFFVFTSFVTINVGFLLSRSFSTFYYLPLNLQYDISWAGLVSLLWLTALICGCVLLAFLGILMGFGTTRRLWTLLAIVAIITPFFYGRMGWPTNILLVSLILIAVETTLIMFGDNHPRKIYMAAGILLTPYVLFLAALNAEQIYITKSVGFSELFRVVLASLPIACIWFGLKKKDFIQANGIPGPNSSSQTLVGQFRANVLLQTDFFLVTLVLAFALVANTLFHVEQYRLNYKLHVGQFGHPPPYGLHSDIVVSNYSIGIPGINKLYEAHLFNFSSFPMVVQTCDFLTDAGAPGIELAYVVQKWDENSRTWTNLNDIAGGFYCGPVPLSKISARPIKRILMPGQSLFTNFEATAAREGFHKGDRARFIVFTRLDMSDPSEGYAFPTPEFLIDEESEDQETQYKIAH